MTNTHSPTRFVILSEARSGTSLLTDTLDTHPEIACHGEVFHPNPEGHVRGTMADHAARDILALREDDVMLYLERVFNQPGVRTSGFKMWRNQAKVICDRLLSDASVAKIILERKNRLSGFSSKLLAHQTGIWNLSADGEKTSPDPEPLVFRAQAFRDFVVYQDEIFQHYRDKTVGPVLDLSFKGLVESGFDAVQDFLGVTRHALQPQKRRLHGTSILSRFREADHPAIKAELDRLGHPDWVTE